VHDIVPTHLHVDQGDAPRLAWTVTTKTTAAVSIFQPAFRNVNRIAITKVESNKIQCETAAVITYKALDTFRFIVGSPPYMTNVSLQLRSPSKDPTYDRPENPLVFMRVGNNHWCHSQCQALSLYDASQGSGSSTSLPTQCPVIKQLPTFHAAVPSTSTMISLAAQLGTEISPAQKTPLSLRPSLSIGTHQVVMFPRK